MRIIGGQFSGRRIAPPAQMPHTRPTTDIAKEGLFNILEHSFSLQGISTLDLFGGTGCISYELASRGASLQTLVEKDPKQVRFIEKTARELGIGNLKVFRADVKQFIFHCKDQFDFIFAGPPYAYGEIDRIPDWIFSQHLLRNNGWFVLEHTTEHRFEGHAKLGRQKNYGSTIFSIFIQD